MDSFVLFVFLLLLMKPPPGIWELLHQRSSVSALTLNATQGEQIHNQLAETMTSLCTFPAIRLFGTTAEGQLDEPAARTSCLPSLYYSNRFKSG